MGGRRLQLAHQCYLRLRSRRRRDAARCCHAAALPVPAGHSATRENCASEDYLPRPLTRDPTTDRRLGQVCRLVVAVAADLARAAGPPPHIDAAQPLHGGGLAWQRPRQRVAGCRPRRQPAPSQPGATTGGGGSGTRQGCWRVWVGGGGERAKARGGWLPRLPDCR